MHDDLFGTLTYDFGWRGSYECRLLGKTYSLTLVLPAYEDEDRLITDHQRQTFRRFHEERSRLLADAEDAVYAYYRQCLPDVRNRLGEAFADKMAPIIDGPQFLNAVMTPTELIVHDDSPPVCGKRVVGLLCDCTWEPSLGLAVRFENEAISEVGTQDIVL